MLNYNLNINSPLQQEKKNEDVRPPIYWDLKMITSASDSSDLNEQSYGAMTITATNSDCIQVTADANGLFTTDAQYPVTASMTGSNWPATGSMSMSLNTAGITYDPASVDQYYSASFRASALDIYNNPNLTGSKIENNFSASEFYRFYVNGVFTHTKGNVWNPTVNWKTINESPSTTTGNVNGYTASFNIVKDVNVPLVSVRQITGSLQSSFQYLYNTGVSSSLTASIQNNATGSTTMSISIPQAGITTSSLYFNQTSAGVKVVSASFTASNNNAYNVTASVIFNKGNESNSNINWKASASSTTQDLEGNSAELNGNVSSFNLKKDIAVMVSYSNISASINGTYKNDYSFNQTASLTSSISSNTTGSVTMSLEIPEIGFSTSSLFFNPTSTGVKILSASFKAQTNISDYNITASVINNKGNTSNSNINWSVSGSGNYLNSASLNIRKDANVTMVSESFYTPKSGTYKNNYAFNQTASLSSSFVPLYNSDSSSYFIQKLDMKISEINFTQSLWISSSCGAPLFNLITASFQAQTNIPNYNITASIQQYQQSVFQFWITASGGGGGGGIGVGGGGGGGMVVSSSATIQPNLVYEINIGEGGGPTVNGSDTTFIGCNRTINIYAGGGAAGGNTVGGGGDSGIGYIIQDGVTSSLYPAFSGGGPAQQSTAFGPRYAGGGGASNTANGQNGDITGAGVANGGDGAGQTGNASGSFGGGGGYQGAGPTPPAPGSDGAAGNGTFGGGGNGASTLGGGSGRAASAGFRGILYIKHMGSGSLFTTTNASLSYDSQANMTVYTFSSGSGTLFYQPTATLS